LVTIRIGERDEELSWEQWEQRVRDGRVPETAEVHFEPVTGDSFVQALQLDMYQSLRDQAGRDWADSYRAGQPPWMTALLAGVMIRLWWLLVTAGTDLAFIPERLVLSHARVFEDGEVWRILTMGILHLSPLHILANLVMFLYVGWNLERALGRLNLLTIFAASIVGGSLLSLLAKPGVVSLGASGGVLGVVAAATVFGFIRHNLLRDRARVVFGWALLPYLALIYFSGWSSESTDNWAHTGGLITGALLALVLDPPGLERRRGWGIAAPVGVGAVCLLIGLATWWSGPSALTIRDTSLRGPGAELRRDHQEVVWSAPTGWQRASLHRRSAFVSRSSAHRGFSVRQRDLAAYGTAAASIERVREDLQDRHGAMARIVAIDDAELAGVAGRRAIVEIDGDPPLHLELRVAVRGLYALESLWSVEASARRRLEPLHQRLLEAVHWNEPTALLEARAEVQRKPRSRPARRQLAEALSLAGEVDKARVILEELIAEQPAMPDGWVALLAHEGRVGAFELPPVETWERALRASDSPSLRSEVALSMHSHGEIEGAVGLMEIAWRASPGDRRLRRARRVLGLPVDLIEATPAHLLHDPITAAPAELREPLGAPDDEQFTLERARAVGRAWLEPRAALARELAQTELPAALGLAVLIRRGVPPTPDTLVAELLATLEDLRLAGSGMDLRWPPPEVASWAEQRYSQDPEFTAPFTLALEGREIGDIDLKTFGLRHIDAPWGPAIARVVATPSAGP